MKTPISRVVTGFDVNVLVGSCLIGMLSSVYGLRNTQQMNASLNKVKMKFFCFPFLTTFPANFCAVRWNDKAKHFLEAKIFVIKILQADQKLTGLCASISVHTACARRLLTTFVSIVYVYIGSMLGKHFHLQAISTIRTECVEWEGTRSIQIALKIVSNRFHMDKKKIKKSLLLLRRSHWCLGIRATCGSTSATWSKCWYISYLYIFY